MPFIGLHPILLVEDDTGIGRFVARGLAAEGYAVTWHRRAAAVRETLVGGDFRAAIVDIGLPDQDGLALCRSLRDAGVTTPIVMLTARIALQDKLDGFAAGADDYLPKPFAFDELLARLAAVIRRGGELPPRPAAIRCGALTLDAVLQTASVMGQAVALTRREFALLAALARHGGEIVTRATLIAEAWGQDGDITDNAVDVYIGYLRRRLAAFAAAPTIRTIRGKGFQFDSVIPTDKPLTMVTMP